MKFSIRRTSVWDDKKSPHKQAKSSRDGWVIEIETLEELLGLSKTSKNELVVKAAHPGLDKLPSIEIYDDYRE